MRHLKKIVVIILISILFTPIAIPEDFICGDADASGGVDITDVVYLVNYMFKSGPPPVYEWKVDYDKDQQFDISDLVKLVNYIMHDTPPVSCMNSSDKNSPCLKATSDYEYNEINCTTNHTDTVDNYQLEWVGNNIKIKLFNIYGHCCIDYHVDYEITYDYDNNLILIDAWGSDLVFPLRCDCDCYNEFVSLTPELFFSGPTLCIVNQHGYIGFGVDSIMIGGEGSLELETDSDSLTINYLNAYYNCCPEFHTDLKIVNDTITVQWIDSFYGCDCLCYYNLSTTLHDMPDGDYTVILLNRFDPPDTVGIETITISNSP